MANGPSRHCGERSKADTFVTAKRRGVGDLLAGTKVMLRRPEFRNVVSRMTRLEGHVENDWSEHRPV